MIKIETVVSVVDDPKTRESAKADSRKKFTPEQQMEILRAAFPDVKKEEGKND